MGWLPAVEGRWWGSCCEGRFGGGCNGKLGAVGPLLSCVVLALASCRIGVGGTAAVLLSVSDEGTNAFLDPSTNNQ